MEQQQGSAAQECQNCARHHQVIAQQRHHIEELESQVRILTEKASAAADKLADYQDALDHAQHTAAAAAAPRSCKAVPPSSSASLDVPEPLPPLSRAPSTDNNNNNSDKALPPPPPPDTEIDSPVTTNSTTPTAPSSLTRRPTVSTRLATFLSARRASPAESPLPQPQPLPTSTSTSTSIPPPSSTTPPSLSSTSQPTTLQRETALRHAAESALAQLHAELEELSATLFEQANTMVATERRARAAAEERLKPLEDRLKLLEGREARMDVLEEAVRRVGRVRCVLGVGEVGVGGGVGRGLVD